MAKRDHIVVGLDIGTTKICAIVAKINEDGSPEVIGMGISPSRGLRKGVVNNIESTVESVKKAIEDAELMAAVQIRSVYTGIAGSHISATPSRAMVTLRRKEVTQADVDRAIEAARWIETQVGHTVPGMLMKAGPFPGAAAPRARQAG